MLDANKNYFVSTYLIDFSYRHLMSKLKMNKSAFADGAIFLNGTLVKAELFTREHTKTI